MKKVISFNLDDESQRIIKELSVAIEKIGNKSAALNMIVHEWAEHTVMKDGEGNGDDN